MLFFEEGRGGWQIGRDIGPHATVAASASKGAVEAADSCPEKAGPYYALRSKALGWDRQVAITMRCLDNIATRDAAATSAAEHGEAAPQPRRRRRSSSSRRGRSSRQSRAPPAEATAVRRWRCTACGMRGPSGPARIVSTPPPTPPTARGSPERTTCSCSTGGTAPSGRYIAVRPPVPPWLQRIVRSRHARARPASPLCCADLEKKRFLYYWSPFTAWRIGNDWQTAAAIATSPSGEPAHCPAKASRFHVASAGHSSGWNESAPLFVRCTSHSTKPP